MYRLVELLRQEYSAVVVCGVKELAVPVGTELESQNSYTVCVVVDSKNTPLTWKFNSKLKVSLAAIRMYRLLLQTTVLASVTSAVMIGFKWRLCWFTILTACLPS